MNCKFPSMVSVPAYWNRAEQSKLKYQDKPHYCAELSGHREVKEEMQIKAENLLVCIGSLCRFRFEPRTSPTYPARVETFLSPGWRLRKEKRDPLVASLPAASQLCGTGGMKNEPYSRHNICQGVSVCGLAFTCFRVLRSQSQSCCSVLTPSVA